jgi:tyrosinase
MRRSGSGLTRRHFLETSTAAAALSALPLVPARAKEPAYTRYPVDSREGQEMLDSYRRAIMVMLDLKPDHPHNWFRNAFVHTYDCPHHNWWFTVWHRGYTGWFERTVRLYSKNPKFAFPYWDWSRLPYVPKGMFDGVLTPTAGDYDKFISSYKTFQDFIGPSLDGYWKTLTPVQSKLLQERQMATVPDVWSWVVKRGMYATTKYARYPSRDKPDLDAATRDATSATTVARLMQAPTFETFNSGQTDNHGQMSATIAPLESTPHDLTHNFCGGANIVPADQMGFMQDNLSPSDPLFFLHHANVDRLWHNWTQNQIAAGKPYKPQNIDVFMKEAFPFFFDENGKALTGAVAADYFDIGAFDYRYQEPAVVVAARAPAPPAAALRAPIPGSMNRGTATLAVPAEALAEDHVLVVQVTIANPTTLGAPRAFAVLANAPESVTTAGPDSPYYIGAVAFFGVMPGMGGETTFSVPVPADKQRKLAAGPLQIRAVPVAGPAPARGPGAARAPLQAPPPAQPVLTGASATVW